MEILVQFSRMDWTITLFPTMPLALLAVLSTAPAPSLILVEDDSVLNCHVSGTVAPGWGYRLRTYAQRISELESSHAKAHPTPSTNLVFHRNLRSMNNRLNNNILNRELLRAWNHVENVREEELYGIMADPLIKSFSATINLPGFPGSVGVLLTRDRRKALIQAAVALGLDYQATPGVAYAGDSLENNLPERRNANIYPSFDETTSQLG